MACILGVEQPCTECRMCGKGKFEEKDIRTCPVCNNEVDREDMDYTEGGRAD